MSSAYLHRLIYAAHDLAWFDDEIRASLQSVDWGECLTPETDDEGHFLNCLRQDGADATDPFAETLICAKCRENQDILKAVKLARYKRYLAMKRVIQLSKHVGAP